MATTDDNGNIDELIGETLMDETLMNDAKFVFDVDFLYKTVAAEEKTSTFDTVNNPLKNPTEFEYTLGEQQPSSISSGIYKNNFNENPRDDPEPNDGEIICELDPHSIIEIGDREKTNLLLQYTAEGNIRSSQNNSLDYGHEWPTVPEQPVDYCQCEKTPNVASEIEQSTNNDEQGQSRVDRSSVQQNFEKVENRLVNLIRALFARVNDKYSAVPDEYVDSPLEETASVAESIATGNEATLCSIQFRTGVDCELDVAATEEIASNDGPVVNEETAQREVAEQKINTKNRKDCKAVRGKEKDRKNTIFELAMRIETQLKNLPQNIDVQKKVNNEKGVDHPTKFIESGTKRSNEDDQMPTTKNRQKSKKTKFNEAIDDQSSLPSVKRDDFFDHVGIEKKTIEKLQSALLRLMDMINKPKGDIVEEITRSIEHRFVRDEMKADNKTIRFMRSSVEKEIVQLLTSASNGIVRKYGNQEAASSSASGRNGIKSDQCVPSC